MQNAGGTHAGSTQHEHSMHITTRECSKMQHARSHAWKCFCFHSWLPIMHVLHFVIYWQFPWYLMCCRSGIDYEFRYHRCYGCGYVFGTSTFFSALACVFDCILWGPLALIWSCLVHWHVHFWNTIVCAWLFGELPHVFVGSVCTCLFYKINKDVSWCSLRNKTCTIMPRKELRWTHSANCEIGLSSTHIFNL